MAALTHITINYAEVHVLRNLISAASISESLFARYAFTSRMIDQSQRDSADITWLREHVQLRFLPYNKMSCYDSDSRLARDGLDGLGRNVQAVNKNSVR